MAQAVKIKDLPNELNKIPKTNFYIYLSENKKIPVSVQEGEKRNIYNIKVDSAFTITFILKNKKDISYKFSIFPEQMEDIDTVINVFTFAKNLVAGSIFINDIKLVDYKLKGMKKDDIKTLNFLINHWKKLRLIENKLLAAKAIDSKISPALIVKNDIVDGTAFKALYRCLIDNKPYKLTYTHVGSMIVTFAKADIDRALKTTEKLTINFVQEKSDFLASKKITVYIATTFFNVLIDKYEEVQIDGDKVTCRIYPKSNSDMYITEQIFLDNDGATKFLHDDASIEILKQATPL